MHPVEHLLYFTRSFVCLFIGLHPIHMIAAFSRSTFSPGTHAGYPPATSVPSLVPCATCQLPGV